MSKLDKALDLYLRGHRSSYIKRRTDVSTQSLLKQLRTKGRTFTKDDIRRYQVEYIREKYDASQIADAYRDIIFGWDDPYKAGHSKRIVALGCGFGDYAKVFRILLGDVEYDALRNECWAEKQRRTVRSRYGVDNVFQKESFSDFVSDEAVANGREKRRDTMLERYGVEEPLQNAEIRDTMVDSRNATMLERYGVVNPMQIPGVADKATSSRKKTMLARYGAENSVEVDVIRERIFEARKRNGTMNTSSPEELMHELLKVQFGDDDVVHDAFIDDRYPYHVDFYIKSRDLFIELNGDKCHGGHWFDASSASDMQRVESWRLRDEELSKKTGKPSRYASYLKTWCEHDVEKRDVAKKHGLNYLVFWDGSSYMRNNKREARLSDFHDWLSVGCPDPLDWKEEHTYSVD